MQKYIFNRKVLNGKLKQFHTSNIPDFDEKINIIKSWQLAIEKRDIDKTKEEAIKGHFLQQIFIDILGFKTQIDEDTWNIQIETKTDLDATRADATLGFYDKEYKHTYAIVEIKDANTPLDKKQSRSNGQTPVEQAFSYQLKTFYNLNFDELLDELKKKRVKLSLDEQDEWEEYFNEKRNSINNIVEEETESISSTNRLINQIYQV